MTAGDIYSTNDKSKANASFTIEICCIWIVAFQLMVFGEQAVLHLQLHLVYPVTNLFKTFVQRDLPTLAIYLSLFDLLADVDFPITLLFALFIFLKMALYQRLTTLQHYQALYHIQYFFSVFYLVLFLMFFMLMFQFLSMHVNLEQINQQVLVKS